MRTADSRPGRLSQDVASLPCAPTSVGTFHVQVTIDGDGGFAATAATTLVVHAAPAILGFAPSASTGEVGLPLGFTVTAVNGTGPLVYGYSNLPPGCRSSDAASLGCIPTSAGVYPVTATVTDTLGVIVVADSLLTVVPSLAITSVVAEHSAIDLGQALALATSVNGGYGPVGYVYFGLPSGCSSVDLGNLSCQPSTLGRFPVEVSALDSLGARAAGSATVVVNALPTVASFVPSSRSVPAGGPVQLTTTVSGGTAPFQYQFSGLPSGCAWNGGAVVNCAGTPNGRFTVGVEVTDATGATTNSSTTFLVGPATGVGPVAPGSSGGLGSAFWWGLAVGAVLVGVAAIVGGNRLRLARQGEHIVQNLRESEALPMGASLSDDSTETPCPVDRPNGESARRVPTGREEDSNGPRRRRVLLGGRAAVNSVDFLLGLSLGLALAAAVYGLLWWMGRPARGQGFVPPTHRSTSGGSTANSRVRFPGARAANGPRGSGSAGGVRPRGHRHPLGPTFRPERGSEPGGRRDPPAVATAHPACVRPGNPAVGRGGAPRAVPGRDGGGPRNPPGRPRRRPSATRGRRNPARGAEPRPRPRPALEGLPPLGTRARAGPGSCGPDRPAVAPPANPDAARWGNSPEQNFRPSTGPRVDRSRRLGLEGGARTDP